MSTAHTKITTKMSAALTVVLLAGVGLTSGASAAQAATSGFCDGGSAPAHTSTGNQSPVLTDDTAHTIAGGSITIPVLANDHDPNGDKLYVVSTSSPARGDVCVDSDGQVEYTAGPGATDYTDTFTYGVTDGDYYRVAKVTVSVEGIKPVRATLKHRLVRDKATHQVTHKARIAFTNHNANRGLMVLVGSPHRRKPLFERFVPAGRTVAFRTRYRTVSYAVIAPNGPDDFALVDLGLLNTATGRQVVLDGSSGFRMWPEARGLAQRSLHR